MDASSSTSIAVFAALPTKARKFHFFPKLTPFGNVSKSRGSNRLAFPACHVPAKAKIAASSSTAPKPASFDHPSAFRKGNRHWLVSVEVPPSWVGPLKRQIVDYYVGLLARVLGSERDAQACVYEASSGAPFGFCCDLDEETARELADLPEVSYIRPDPDYIPSGEKHSEYLFDYVTDRQLENTLLFPTGSTKKWLVRISRPGIAVVTKAQMVDYYAQILGKVLGNEKDAQMCIYHVSWQSNFGFCCELDEECARELAEIPGVLSVRSDENFGSNNKDYAAAPEADHVAPVKTKKLFVTGLSFYTSEKTLRAAFEGFGELVEVKVIMDKISKRSKGYAFVEYTTEEAASAALKEMNGKIINGWMIVVDVAKSNPPRRSGSRTAK